MKIMEMTAKDIKDVIPLYMDHYNNYEDCSWTEEQVQKRIHQIVTIEDGFSQIMREEDGSTLGFVMGWFRQYDDLVSYYLDEIVVVHSKQSQGYGSTLLAEVDRRVKEKGAAGVELQAINDEMHDHFYTKAGFGKADNYVLRCKWF